MNTSAHRPFFALILGLFSCFLQYLFAQESTEESDQNEGMEAITLEQIQNLRSNLDAIIDGYAQARDARQAAAFEQFEKIIDNDLELYNLYKDSVELLRYSNEEENPNAAEEYRAWRNRLDEEVNRADFACMVRAQIQWLALLKRIEIARREAGVLKFSNEAQIVEREFAPEAIALMEEIIANGESYGKHFTDLRRSVIYSPIAKANGFSTGRTLNPFFIPQAPLNFENLYRNGLILPAVRNQDEQMLDNSWARLMQVKKEVLRLSFEIRKKEAIERERQQGRTRTHNGRDRNASRVGNFEDSPEWKTFQESILPSLMWRREIDRFNMGAEVQAARNMYSLLQKYPNHPRYNNWIKSIRSLVAKSDQKRAKEKAQQKS